jgi:Domain of unknown function (DUF4126)
MESLAYVFTSGWASGINVYATLLVIGLVGRFGDVERVPDELKRTDVLLLTAVLSALEFVADKIPYVDSAWDAVHTVIRPAVGAILGALLAGRGRRPRRGGRRRPRRNDGARQPCRQGEPPAGRQRVSGARVEHRPEPV